MQNIEFQTCLCNLGILVSIITVLIQSNSLILEKIAGLMLEQGPAAKEEAASFGRKI